MVRVCPEWVYSVLFFKATESDKKECKSTAEVFSFEASYSLLVSGYIIFPVLYTMPLVYIIGPLAYILLP